MDKDERKKSLKEYRDFLKELMVKPEEEYPDAEHIIREDIIDSIVFDDIGGVHPDEEIKLGESIGDSFRKNKEEFLNDFESLSASDKKIAILNYKLCSAENNMIPYEVLLARQARFRNINSEKEELDLIDILDEVKYSLLDASLDYYANSLDLVITQLQIDGIQNQFLKCNKGGSKPLPHKQKIIEIARELLIENTHTISRIAELAIERLTNNLPQAEADEINDKYKVETVRSWVNKIKKEIVGK